MKMSWKMTFFDEFSKIMLLGGIFGSYCLVWFWPIILWTKNLPSADQAKSNPTPTHRPTGGQQIQRVGNYRFVLYFLAHCIAQRRFASAAVRITKAFATRSKCRCGNYPVVFVGPRQLHTLIMCTPQRCAPLAMWNLLPEKSPPPSCILANSGCFCSKLTRLLLRLVDCSNFWQFCRNLAICTVLISAYPRGAKNLLPKKCAAVHLTGGQLLTPES